MPFSEPYNKPFVLNEPKWFMLNGLRGIEPRQETMDFSPLEDVILARASFLKLYTTTIITYNRPNKHKSNSTLYFEITP